MKPFLRGKTWYIRYWYGGKDRWEAVGSSKRQAELALAKRKTEIAEGRFLDPLKGNKITYGELLDRYLKEYAAVYKRPNSYRNNIHEAKHLRPRFGSLLIKDVTAEDASSMVHDLVDSGLKPSTVNRVVALLKHSFTKAREWGLIRHSPVADVKKLPEHNERRRFLTYDQYERLLGELQEWHRPIIVTAVNTGMRLREILWLRWDEVDFRVPSILLTNTKNGEPRGVPLNSTMVNVLRDLSRNRMRHGSASGYVFVNPLSRGPWKSIRNTFNAAVKSAGIENFRFHDLRHTAASWLVMSGVDRTTVASILGHKDLRMTDRYSHLSPEHRLQAVEALKDAKKLFSEADAATEL